MTTTDLASLAENLPKAVPFVGTLGIEYLELESTRALLRLPDNPAHRNHVAGPHAGAMFTLAESASGAVVVAAFGDQLARATPLPVHAEVNWTKVARGAVLAEAVLGRPVADVLAELDAGQRPEFPITVEVRTEDGTVTNTMTVIWTLRPNR